MEENFKQYRPVINRVYELKEKALSSDENEKEKAIAELRSIKHFHLGLSVIASEALEIAGYKENLQVFKDIQIAKRKSNTGKVVLQIAIVAVMFAIFANANESWYWSFAKALGLYIAVGFAIYLTGGLKYFRKVRK